MQLKHINICELVKVAAYYSHKKNNFEAQKMVEIDNEKYSIEYLRKAICFYKALTSGAIEKAIREGLENEL